VQTVLLAANHVLLGPTNLFILGLPDGWRLATGQGHPEVDAMVHWRGCQWMKTGRAWYYLWPGPGPARLEMTVHVGERGAHPPDERIEEAEFNTAGHAGRYALGYRRRRWPGPARRPLLWATLECQQTERRLDLEILDPGGSADVEPLRSFVPALGGLECH
jgi:hypothetical protein